MSKRILVVEDQKSRVGKGALLVLPAWAKSRTRRAHADIT